MAFSLGPPSTQTSAPSAVSGAPVRHSAPAARPCPVRPRRAQSATIGRSSVARPLLRAPGVDLGRRAPPYSGSGQSAGGVAPFGSASAPKRSIMRSSLRSPQRMSLISRNRPSPAKPVRSGMPARNGRQRRFPGPRHDQRRAVMLGPQPGAPASRYWPSGSRRRGRSADDAFAHARHVIEQRGAERGGQKVDRPVRASAPAAASPPNAAHEIADPHIGDDQDRARRQAAYWSEGSGPFLIEMN